ncbi:MAG: hypothetical protein HRT53_02825 [Colwellia sp.]|nr:hypothetical protein [Colwellia sp.]
MRLYFLMLLGVLLSGCSNIEQQNGTSQWDFDHNVQFKQTELSENKYHLQVWSKSDTHFSKLATFMMRRSYEICGTYGFTIEVLKGIEKFTDRQSFPNLIMPSLSANIKCPSQ